VRQLPVDLERGAIVADILVHGVFGAVVEPADGAIEAGDAGIVIECVRAVGCAARFAHEDLEQYREVIARLAEEAEPAGRRSDPIEGLDPGNDAVDPAVALLVKHRRAPTETVVDDGAPDCGLCLEQAVVAAGENGVAVVVAEARIARIEIDGATGGVL